jgi:hypothetical protein
MIRHVACLAALLILVTSCRGQAPAGLTAEDVADGWLALFDGETDFGWTLEGDAKVKDSALRLVTPEKAEQPTQATTTVAFSNFILEFEIDYQGQQHPKVVLHGNEYDLPATVQGVKLSRPTYRFEVQASGTTHTVSAFLLSQQDGEKKMVPLFERTPPKPGNRTTVGLRVPPGISATLRSARLKPGDLKPLYNGKDLTGWTEFPGKKSHFTITKEGWLNIKDGPGDLQTESSWGDFVLQIDCLSNGDHLNSGVFFRCRPGEYQQGYEAQIRNQFTAEPAQEYVLEDYDPATNQLTGTRKVKYTAVDYGTGGIYRRMPARREVARDRQWFTMTVVAQGKHLATWVNGLAVVDWIDNRPLADNARNGCRLEKGPLSLQGHDATTDLSFRNLRVAELPQPAK